MPKHYANNSALDLNSKKTALKKLGSEALILLGALILLIAFLFYFAAFDFKPQFTTNDSFQYLNLAKNIYANGRITGITNYAFDLYYDELATFNYDFKNLKPYHFPSYPAFLSLFYHICQNDIFVVFASQYIAYLLLLSAIFLVFNFYLSTKESIILSLASVFCTPIIFYISGSSKEVLCAALGMWVIYLGLFYQGRFKVRTLLLTSGILVFLSITRNFYLILGLLIACYNSLPIGYKEDKVAITLKTKFLGFLFLFLIPAAAYFYCYHIIEIHLFLFDNRTSIYGGKDIEDLLMRIFTNLFLGTLVFFVQFFDFILSKFSPSNLNSLYPYHLIFVPPTLFLFRYFYQELVKVLKTRNIKITKIFIINSFFLGIIVAVVCRFNFLGYRLTLGFLPILLMLCYKTDFVQEALSKNRCKAQDLSYLGLLSKRDKGLEFFINSIKNFNLGKLLLLSFVALVLLCNFCILIKNYKTKAVAGEINQEAIDQIKNYQAQNVATNALYFNKSHMLPFYHLYPRETNFYNSWDSQYFCLAIKNYYQHGIEFDLLLFSYDPREKCDFVKQKFMLVKKNEQGMILVNQNKL